MVTGGHRTIKVWRRDADSEEWLLAHTLRGHRNEIWTLSFSNDDRLIASGGHDSTARIWDIESGKQLACLPCWNNEYAVCFGENDSVLHVVDAGQTGSVPIYWNAGIQGSHQ